MKKLLESSPIAIIGLMSNIITILTFALSSELGFIKWFKTMKVEHIIISIIIGSGFSLIAFLIKKMVVKTNNDFMASMKESHELKSTKMKEFYELQFAQLKELFSSKLTSNSGDFMLMKKEFVSSILSAIQTQKKYTDEVAFTLNDNNKAYFFELQKVMDENTPDTKKIRENKELSNLIWKEDKQVIRQEDSLKKLIEELEIFKEESTESILEHIKAKNLLQKKSKK